MKYNVTEEKKHLYAGIYLLEYIINKKATISVFLDGENEDLEPVLEWLMSRSYIEIKDNSYVQTSKGQEVFSTFMKRYSEYLTVFDIYCAVDLGTGEFAFSSYFDFSAHAQWQQYLNQDNWEDVRIAVAEFKKMDPVEIVFMSYINEGRFGRDTTGWQFDLLLGTVWDQILNICNNSLSVADLGYEDDMGKVPAEDVMCDIISQGTDIMKELHMHEEKLSLQHQAEQEEEAFGQNNANGYVEEVITTEYYHDYYDPWYDPYYVSPIWLGLLLL